jgi:hypothetical protein
MISLSAFVVFKRDCLPTKLSAAPPDATKEPGIGIQSLIWFYNRDKESSWAYDRVGGVLPSTIELACGLVLGNAMGRD